MIKKRKISLRGEKFLIVRRNFGWYHRKYGIVLDYLLDTQIRLLKENKFIRDIATDEQAMYIVFHLLEMENQNKRFRKLWYNPFTDTATDFRTIVKNSKEIEWECAICKTSIISNMEKFDATNFLCEECRDIYYKPEQKVDSRIVKSSIKFTNHCKKLLRKEQKTFMTYTSRNTRAIE